MENNLLRSILFKNNNKILSMNILGMRCYKLVF
jgi:hypothetical protein